jgi:23S rRNA (uracil747-C5)-methyltransferase
VLGPDESLAMELNGLPLHLRPRSFFQTNTGVAAALYRQARDWVREAQPASLWDLYCGVGGFALHCAGDGRVVTGVEASDEAIASALRSRSELGLAAEGPSAVRFVAADALDFVRSTPAAPAMVVVNPPRRGIGRPLAELLDASASRWMVYSSCNAESLARDLASMPSWTPLRARVLDMFPHTPHYELLVLLERRAGTALPA